jgi:TolB-like protein/cytochrome c-type biogenesis protein CcmH/NrfG
MAAIRGRATQSSATLASPRACRESLRYRICRSAPHSRYTPGRREDALTDTPTERDNEGAWVRLRRRKVVQWGLAYAAGAWALLQVIGFAADAFHWPDVTKQLSMLTLAIGLPVAMTLAWYHGDRGEQSVTRTELAVLTLLLFLGGGVLWLFKNRTVPPPLTANVSSAATVKSPSVATSDLRPSIAVLPFANMSPDKDQEYFSDGLSEQILDVLGEVPQLRVIARTSSFSFKAKVVDAATIARALGVSHLLEGSVRRSGNRLRISAKLVRAADSSQLWAETYDRQLEDVFKVQDEIAQAVVAQLRVRMVETTIRPNQTTAPEIYADFLRARQLYRSRTRTSLEQASALLERVVATDEDYGAGWRLLSQTYVAQAWAGFLPLHQGFAKARAAIQRAIDIDPSDAAAIAVLANVSRAYDLNLPETARLLKRALSISRHDETVLSAAASLTRATGDGPRTIAIYENLVRFDPVNGGAWNSLGFAYMVFDRYDDAVVALRKSLEVAPNAVFTHELLGEALMFSGDLDGALAEMQREPHDTMRRLGLALVYAALGRREESQRLLEDVGREHPDFASPVAAGFARLGKSDEAFEWLDRALQERDGGVLEVRTGPLFQPLRADPRWKPFLRRVGLSDEQVAALDFKIEVPRVAGSSGVAAH